MSNNLKKASAASGAAIPALDEFKQAEAATELRLRKATEKLAQLQARYNNPEPGDTVETLAQIERDAANAKHEVRLAKSNFDRAGAARATAEAELAEAERTRRGAELRRRLDETVKSMPALYHQHAEALLALVVDAHRLDAEIVEHNKALPQGAEPISTFEQRVRWSAADPTNAQGSILPEPLGNVFEIPVLARGDRPYIVPGCIGVGYVWIDPNNRACAPRTLNF